ncbi:hypothetical protein PPERSA_03621 [Pseudocohnilembus persalinus]|uniref:SAC domain-containing protein n=1 Tax=Pseudocohnilembus persalinus TaxID=266149 RepID=A0A0V0QE67_PSEPJ|nr:hypothetical protein PPERSA_03621 [Pseudocohnilembus persalinus]|eukprot:KRX00400.1 hypothetical protein PPERSA_03621 [Pseudocohnilembus persalinus]
MNLEHPVNSDFIKYQEYHIYKSKYYYYFAGLDKIAKNCQIIRIEIKKFKNDQPHQLNNILKIIDIKYPIDTTEVITYLCKLDQTLKQNQKPDIAFGIVGFFQFLEGYYAIIITEKLQVGNIGQHQVFQIQKTKFLQLFEGSSGKNEKKYLKILKQYDLEFGFYFSYTYDLTNAMNKNLSQNAVDYFDQSIIEKQINQQQAKNQQSSSIYNQLSNNSQDQSQNSLTNRQQQLNINYENSFNTEQSQIDSQKQSVINNKQNAEQNNQNPDSPKKSRFPYEDRQKYQRFVANFVETEQIVIDLENTNLAKPNCSSYVQIRGSAPLFWFQEPNMLTPKPKINLTYQDQHYLVSKKHIADLYALYGEQIFMINLVKSNEKVPREKLIADEYHRAMNTVNEHIPYNQKVKYLHFDMKLNLKRDKEEFLEKVYSLAFYSIMKTGVFLVQTSTLNKKSQIIEFQNGITRSNCIDCLDRTNTFQQLIGEKALGVQLQKLQKSAIRFKSIEVDAKIIENFREMYEQMGDFISLQYGSSIAHKQQIKENQKKRFELLTSIQRHFRNNFSDSSRQQQMDLFLGNFLPQKNDIKMNEKAIQNKQEIRIDKELFQKANLWKENALQYYLISNNIQWLQNYQLTKYSEQERILFEKEINERQQRRKNYGRNSSTPFNIDIIHKLKQNLIDFDYKEKNHAQYKNKGGIVLSLIFEDDMIKKIKHIKTLLPQFSLMKFDYKNIIFFDIDQNQDQKIANKPKDQIIDELDENLNQDEDSDTDSDEDSDESSKEQLQENDSDNDSTKCKRNYEKSMKKLQQKEQTNKVINQMNYLAQQEFNRLTDLGTVIYDEQNQDKIQSSYQKKQLQSQKNNKFQQQLQNKGILLKPDQNESYYYNYMNPKNQKNNLPPKKFVYNNISPQQQQFHQQMLHQQQQMSSQMPKKLQFEDQPESKEFYQKYLDSELFDQQDQIKEFKNLNTPQEQETFTEFDNLDPNFFTQQSKIIENQKNEKENMQLEKNFYQQYLDNELFFENIQELNNFVFEPFSQEEIDFLYSNYTQENDFILENIIQGAQQPGNPIHFYNNNNSQLYAQNPSLYQDFYDSYNNNNDSQQRQSRGLHFLERKTQKMSKAAIDRRKVKILQLIMNRQFATQSETKIQRI